MKQWTVGVINSLRSRGDGVDDKQNNVHKIVCSHQYLTCALKIAHSLADQLSAVEEERGYKQKSPSQCSNNNNSPLLVEASEKSWSEYISVYCTKTKASEEKKEEVSLNDNNNNHKDDEGNASVDADYDPLPYGGDFVEPGDFQHLAQQLSTLLSDNDNKQAIDYLDVRGAILNEGAVKERPLSDNGQLEIRSLGIAFCELFSGGQITADVAMSQQRFAASLSSGRRTQSPFLPSGQIAASELHMRSGENGFKPALESIDIIGGAGDFPLTDSIGGGGSDLFGNNNGNSFDSNNNDGAELDLDDDMSAFGINEENPTKRRAQSDTPLDHSSQKTSLVRTPSASSSVEPLQLLGLPTAICDLISNMMDSVDGDFRGNEGTYEFISEVRDDLQLMIDSPHVYLHNFDLAKAANDGLQFGSSVHGREAELQTLRECYQRAISSEFEVAMICGTSGIGKSELSREFARSAKEEDGGGIFLSGRFDKLQSQPLHAISAAFDNYCAWLSKEDHSTAEKVSTALKENMGEEITSLVSAMPNLSHILGDDFDSKQNDANAVDAQKRLRYLICRFVEVISKCHEEPLILFLDDCQWIDAASSALLIRLMMTGSSFKYQRLFFFMGCRDDEISATHPLNLVLSQVSSFGIKTTKIHLTPLTKGALNELVSTALSLLPRITRPLADILHHKTKGSPLFVKQVMIELYKQRLLYPSLSRRRWDWEADKILAMKVPENVATFITKSFDRLPSEVLSALVVLSCFGASADISLIEVLEREIKQPLIAPLEAAVADSVLGKKDGKFFFMHDKLQETAYSMMKPEERCLHHNLYGQALAFVVVREKDDRYMLTAATQINFGGPQAVLDDNQALSVANLNLDAGKKAMSMSDFFSAHRFFNHGISYLQSGHWNEQYDVSLELFNLAAACALMNAEHERLRVLTGEVIRHAKCFEDKFRAICISITLLLWSSKLPEAMQQISLTLSSLGEELPVAVTQSAIHYQLDHTKTLLAGLSDETLLSYPAMSISSKIMAMELFSKQFINYTFTGDCDAMPIIPLKMVQTSLTYGMSPLSGVGFALFGNYLALAKGEVEEGYRYVKIALSLMKRMPSIAHDSEIMYYSTHTKLRVEPIQSAIEHYAIAHTAAMASGAVRFAFGCAFVYDNSSFWAGKKLDLVVNSMKETMKQMIFYKNLVMIGLLRPICRLSLRLTGQSDVHQRDDLTNIFGETYNEEEGIFSKLPMVMLTECFAKFSEGLIFREVDKARDSIQQYLSIQSLTTVNMSNSGDLFRIFYAGLASFYVGRELDDGVLITRGTECKDWIEKLVVSASTWNFQNKAYLLQAEEQFCERNFDVAERLYDAAILSAKTHKFVNEQALANELAGHFYLDTGRKIKSVNYFMRAFENYNEWGAVAKAASLTKYFEIGDAI
ncbi:putative AAA ATPase [Skeletonema marinoi]|uniref:AAA ATPase n=1 Tax=Skeletonema marinoi TaxID=267567 RepID=A0AAD9DCT3_9STRA|nr:putative AAA ATPase [Skeletonema marinoi]